MTTNNRSETVLRTVAKGRTEMMRNLAVRCPCCGELLRELPDTTAIEPCESCKRPLALVRMASRRRAYRLHNVLDLIGTLHGIATIILVLAFALTEMEALTFAKAITILLFVIASILSTDGFLSLTTGIDKTWNIIRRGTRARIHGLAKVSCGVAGFGLTMIGLTL